MNVQVDHRNAEQWDSDRREPDRDPGEEDGRKLHGSNAGSHCVRQLNEIAHQKGQRDEPVGRQGDDLGREEYSSDKLSSSLHCNHIDVPFAHLSSRRVGGRPPWGQAAAGRRWCRGSPPHGAFDETVPPGGAATVLSTKLGLCPSPAVPMMLPGYFASSFKEVQQWQKARLAAAGAVREA